MAETSGFGTGNQFFGYYHKRGEGDARAVGPDEKRYGNGGYHPGFAVSSFGKRRAEEPDEDDTGAELGKF